MMVSIKVCQKATSWHITWESTGNLNVLKCHKYSFCLITVEYFSRTRRRATYQYIKKEGCSTQSPVQRFFFHNYSGMYWETLNPADTCAQHKKHTLVCQKKRNNFVAVYYHRTGWDRPHIEKEKKETLTMEEVDSSLVLTEFTLV